MTVTTLRKLASALLVTTDFIVNGDETVSPDCHELISVFETLPPEKQNYALQMLRIFALAVNHEQRN